MATSSDVRHPDVAWAQRSDVLFLTVELPDARGVEVAIEPEGRLKFSAQTFANGAESRWELDLELYGKIVVEKSKTSKGVRKTVILLQKAESQWWPRLLKAAGKAPLFVKVDWDKWVDEDEEDGAPGPMDPEFMKQFQGMQDYGAMEMEEGEEQQEDKDDGEDDDDDDDLPELEK